MNGADTAWIMVATALVLFMTLPGLALFYGGLVRSRNVLSVLMQCFAIACVMSILWLVAGVTSGVPEAQDAIRFLAFVNLFIAAFNLLPGRDVRANVLFKRRLNALPDSDAWVDELMDGLELEPLLDTLTAARIGEAAGLWLDPGRYQAVTPPRRHARLGRHPRRRKTVPGPPDGSLCPCPPKSMR